MCLQLIDLLMISLLGNLFRETQKLGWVPALPLHLYTNQLKLMIAYKILGGTYSNNSVYRLYINSICIWHSGVG